MSNSKQWEFHFRNFDSHTNWYGVYHFGCGGAPWHDGRARCWEVDIPTNPTGGHASVYVPSTFIVKEMQWIKVILDSIKELGEIGLAIASEGEDLAGAISGALDIAKDVVEAVSHDIGHDLDELQKFADQSFAASCQAVHKTPDQVRAIAAQLGLGKQFGFLAGEAFQKYIRLDNAQTNDGLGFSIMRAPSDASVNYACTAVFMHKGSVVLYWNSNDLAGFWSTQW